MWEWEKGRRRERVPSRLHTVSVEPDMGLKLTNCEITTSAKIESQILNRLSHPGTPSIFLCTFAIHILSFLLLRGSESAWVDERGRGREIILSRLYTQHGARHGARSHDPGIMTWTEIKSQMLNWLIHPGAPIHVFSLLKYLFECGFFALFVHWIVFCLTIEFWEFYQICIL